MLRCTAIATLGSRLNVSILPLVWLITEFGFHYFITLYIKLLVVSSQIRRLRQAYCDKVAEAIRTATATVASDSDQTAIDDGAGVAAAGAASAAETAAGSLTLDALLSYPGLDFDAFRDILLTHTTM